MKKEIILKNNRGISVISLTITILILAFLVYGLREYIVNDEVTEKADNTLQETTQSISEGNNDINRINDEFIEAPNEVIIENEVTYE